MTRAITKIASLGTRPSEAGRIRLGVKAKTKSGKERPASIETLRFTSPYEDLIRALADQYGGEARPWNEPSARMTHQWEVVTEAADVAVLLPTDALDQSYELWASGGRQRRCDGEQCEVPRKIGESDYEFVTVGCVCRQEGVRSCSPKTRLQVVIPTIPFRGVWRVETGSWTALEELPYQVEMLEALQASGRLVQARLSLHKETKRTPVGTRHYVVIRLSMDATPLELLAGAGGAAELAAAHVAAVDAPRRAALPAGVHTAPDPVESEPRPETTDDDIIDAEIVEDDDDGVLLAGLASDAEQFGLDPARFVAALRTKAECPSGPLTPEARDALRTARGRMASGEFEPTGFKSDGSVAWRKS